MNEQNPLDITATLIERAQDGDQDAYDKLFAAASERALLFIRLRLGPQLRQSLESMDVLQDAYFDAYQALSKFEHRDDSAFAKWLCRIIENRIRGLADHFSAQKRRPPEQVVSASRLAEQAHSRIGPVTDAGRIEERRLLAAAIEELEPELREVVLLHFFQGRGVEEIAELTDKSSSTVRRILGRSMAAIGRLIHGERS